MATKTLDARGLKCPRPALMMASESRSMAKRDLLEVVADCPTFEEDARKWCDQTKRALLWVKNEGGSQKRIQVRI
jgi:tRNA 2-thiouridine synthesizing protein A